MKKLKKYFLYLMIALVFTQISAQIPRKSIGLCHEVDIQVPCELVAAGFPFIYIVDLDGISPVGSVETNPLFLLAGEDHFIWIGFISSVLFWWIMILVVHKLYKMFEKLNLMK